jgi:hypothetical protein
MMVLFTFLILGRVAVYSQAKATLAQFDVQHRINCTSCSRARDTSMTRVTARSAVVVSTVTTVPVPGPPVAAEELTW